MSSAFMKPMRPSSDLAAIVGDQPLPRSEVVSKMWEYIKANDLQDPKNRREIIADDKLRPVFGGEDRVNMFAMNGCISKHLQPA